MSTFNSSKHDVVFTVEPDYFFELSAIKALLVDKDMPFALESVDSSKKELKAIDKTQKIIEPKIYGRHPSAVKNKIILFGHCYYKESGFFSPQISTTFRLVIDYTAGDPTVTVSVTIPERAAALV
jgi:hypothetical protein